MLCSLSARPDCAASCEDALGSPRLLRTFSFAHVIPFSATAGTDAWLHQEAAVPCSSLHIFTIQAAVWFS